MNWVITCNTKMFDIQKAFESISVIDWKQSANIQVGDFIFIYVGVPVKVMCYKCEVLRTDMNQQEIDDSAFVKNYKNYKKHKKYMRLKLQEKYDDALLPYEELIINGLKTLQGPSRVSEELLQYLEEKINI